MSFSQDVKNELALQLPTSRHCRLAELGAILDLLDLNGKCAVLGEEAVLTLRFEHHETAKKVFTLLKQAFKIKVVCFETKSSTGKTSQMIVEAADPEEAALVRKTLKQPSLLSQECCRTSYLRGAFLASGSVNDPEKCYHCEFVCPDEACAMRIKDTMKKIGVESKIVLRKKDYVVYIKEGDSIEDLLGAMGASISYLNIASIRVTKGVRENINRQVNCETANMNKTIHTAVKQIADIEFIRDQIGFSALPESLRQMAEVRLEHQEAALGELGTLLDPPLGKSGVNHRLRKLSEMAGELREKMNGL